jgi:acyl-CoA synthetase (NDP forming)
LRAWFEWHARGPAATVVQARVSSPRAAEAARAIVTSSKGLALNEVDSKRVLAAYGIAVPAEAMATDPDSAAVAAIRIGFPVVAKIVSVDIPHKTEAGGVKLSLRSHDEVRDAAAAILQSARAYAPSAVTDGISIQQMLPPGTELVLGIKQDLQFGPLIAVGLGGVAVELLRDTAVRLAPVTADGAREMLRSLRTFPLLDGYRGATKVDLDRLCEMITRLSEMASDLQDVIEEVDINPVITRGDSIVAADALVVSRA